MLEISPPQRRLQRLHGQATVSPSLLRSSTPPWSTPQSPCTCCSPQNTGRN